MPIKIIGGEAKGRRVKATKGKEVRPLLARVKKSLFDILKGKIGNSFFLDLYAGTGSVGIEALSRGAKEAVFIENNYHAVEIIKKNLEELGFGNRARVLKKDVLHGLPENCKFNLIFVGPPYLKGLVLPTLKVIAEKEILTEKGWLICQHHFREELPEEYYSFCLFRREKYGDMRLSFYEVRTIESEKPGLTSSE